jgi:ribosomal protein S18 acetylase RimI-like enzyme
VVAHDVVDHPLDNPASSALAGPHAAFAVWKGRAARYRPDVSPFAALPLDPDETDWTDLAALVEEGAEVLLTGPEPRTPPPGWEQVMDLRGVQMEGSRLDVRPDPDALVLGEADVQEMLDLVARTCPGPFRTGTRLMGTYLGVRRGGVLVAMAGERMHPPGWSEISAVCTDPAYRGQSLASRLIRAVGAVIRERGDVPFLHAAGHNTGAIRLYEHLGFEVRRKATFTLLRTPSVTTPAPAERQESHVPVL